MKNIMSQLKLHTYILEQLSLMLSHMCMHKIGHFILLCYQFGYVLHCLVLSKRKDPNKMIRISWVVMFLRVHVSS